MEVEGIQISMPRCWQSEASVVVVVVVVGDETNTEAMPLIIIQHDLSRTFQSHTIVWNLR